MRYPRSRVQRPPPPPCTILPEVLCRATTAALGPATIQRYQRAMDKRHPIRRHVPVRWRQRTAELVTALVLTLVALAFLFATLPR